MKIRKATIVDLELVTGIEAACFPPAEAASKDSFEQRLKVYPEYFWIVEDEGMVIGFINGPVIDQNVIADSMYADVSCHNVNGKWQTVFGINTLPEYRKRGVGGLMLQAVIEEAKKSGRQGCVLTCKDYLLSFYESYGFRSMGESESSHGGAKWNDMILEF